MMHCRWDKRRHSMLARLLITLTVPFAMSEATGMIRFTNHSVARIVPPYFFGMADPKLADIHKARMEYTNDSLIGLKRDMHIQHERGPCGTGANFFLWRTGYAMTSRHPGYADVFGDVRIGMVESTGDDVPVPLSRDILFRDSDALDIPYLYCMNVFSDPDDEIIASAADIKRRIGKRPVLLELGNEVYSIHFKKRFPTVDDYISFVQRISPKLRSVIGKNGKLSVVGFSPVMYAEMGLTGGTRRPEAMSEKDYEFTQAGRVERWNERLALAKDSFDAVSIHYYNRIRSFDRLPTPDDAMSHFFAGNRYYYETMCALSNVFFGKELWATEWNVFNVKMLEAKTDDEKSRYNISKHSGTAVVLASLQLAMLATGLYTISSPHSFYTANGFGFVNFKDRDNRSVKVKMPQYYTLQAIGGILARYHSYIPLAPTGDVPDRTWMLEPMNTPVSYAPVDAYGFGDSAAQVIVFINNTKEAQQVSLPGHTMRRIWAYGEPNPFPDYLLPKKYHWTSAPDVIPLPRKYAERFESIILLEPYGMTVADVDIPSNIVFE